jgi:Ca2+-binding EF-hand superfamily protein
MIALPVLLVALAAADPPPSPTSPIQIVGTRRYYGPPFISPMGEPFRQKVPHDDPLADWFRQADRNHDGYLTQDEMVLDADRFFALLDVNHDGQIDADEIERYEQLIAPEVAGEPLDLQGPQQPAGDDSTDLSNVDPDENATRIKTGGNSDQSDSGAGRFSLFDIPEPVAAADTDLSRSVSLDEFRKAARLRFSLLDSARTGRLTLDELERDRR